MRRKFDIFLLIIKMRTKFNISTQNTDDSGEHALYNRYRSLRYLQFYYKRQKERKEIEGKHTYQYVTLNGQVKERYSVIIICED